MKTSKTTRGSIMMMILPIVLGIFLIGMALFSMTTTSTRTANFGYEKSQADALAESGLDAMYSQIANTPQGGTINTASISSTTLKGSVASSSNSDGTFSGSVVSSSSALVSGQQTYTYVIQGNGIAPNGVTTSKVRTTLTVTQTGMPGFSLGDDAVKTAGSINMSGGSYTQDNSGNNSASMFANGSITDSSGADSIDGTAGYYGASSLTGKAYTLDKLTTPMSFPSATTTAQWRSTWLSQAEESTPSHPSGNIVNGSLSYSANTTLTAPVYITGNLTESGGKTLTINVDPAASTPVVVFVHGTVTISGGSSLVNNGVLLVSDGNQTYSGGSGVYKAANLVDCGIISFSTDPINAINVTGGSGVCALGVAYAINGGMTLSGGSVFQGSCTCGGASSTFTISGGSSVRYQSGWNSKFAPFAPTYTSSSQGHWVRVE